MKRCFAYVRVSTAKQGEGVSLEAQKEAITAFSEREGFQITQWFTEKETAAKRGRPIFDAMVRDLLKGRADGLVIHKIDRSARNFADWAKIGDLQDAGVDIHFATETLDFRSRGGRLTADIQAVIAADYIRNLREETIKGINGRLKQGLYPFKAPIGYVDNGGGKPKTIDPTRGPLVRQAFELYASGRHSLRSLLKELDERGLRNERGKPISKCCLENMLSNPFYTGIIRIQRSGAIFTGIHKPLIPASLFEDVQDRKAGRTVQKHTRHRYTYRSQFRCKHCDCAMIAERQKGHVYYRCHTAGCPTKTVREELIETTIWQTLRESKLAETDVVKISQRISAWLEGRKDKGRKLALQNELNGVQDKLDRLTDALIDRLIDEDTFAERKQRLLLEQSKLQEQLRDATEKTVDPATVTKFLELVKNVAVTYLIANPGEKREIAEIATSNRVVSGKSVYVEPSKWLSEVSWAIAGLCGGPDQTTDRTRRDMLQGIESQNQIVFANRPKLDGQGRDVSRLINIIEQFAGTDWADKSKPINKVFQQHRYNDEASA